MTKKILAVLAAAAITFNVSAQNARVDAMAGLDIMGDISLVSANPSTMNDYADVLQGTMASSYSPVIGIKSINDMLNIGTYIWYGGSSYLMTTFQQDAINFLESASGSVQPNPFSSGELESDFVAFPHILFGIDLDAVKIGLDLFYEASTYSNEIVDDTSTTKTKTTEEQRVSNIGGTIDASITLGNFSLFPRFSLYLPRVKGYYFFEPDGGTNVTQEIGVSSAMGINGGIEARTELADMEVLLGFNGGSESYLFNYKDDDTSYDDATKYKTSLLEFYVGAVKEFESDLLLAMEYAFGIGIIKDELTADGVNPLDKTYGFAHLIAVGMERPIEGKKFLDIITPRCGIDYQIIDTKFKRSMSSGSTYEVNTKWAAEQADNVLDVTAGLGVTKGCGTLDVSANLASWSGVLSGPDVVRATITVDFKNIKKSMRKKDNADSYSAPAPSYESTPASTYESTPATEETTNDTETSGGSFDF